MKILPAPQEPAQTADTAENKAEQAASRATAHAVAKTPTKTDSVDFSATLSQGINSQAKLQANRVASVKSRIEAGTYQVSSHDVATKMLSGASEFTSS